MSTLNSIVVLITAACDLARGAHWESQRIFSENEYGNHEFLFSSFTDAVAVR